MLKALILFVYCLSAYAQQAQAYVPPVPLIEPLSPAGIRISIPDEPGIRLVAFHVKFNNEFVGLEAGTIARDVVTVNNGRWTYYDRSTLLRKDDTIYYWVHVIYNNLGYNLVNQKYIVKNFYDYNGNKIQSPNDSHNNGMNSNNSEDAAGACGIHCYVPPVPFIEPLSPSGIRMSIPDEAGISLVAFHVKFNQKLIGLEAGTIARDIVEAKNNRWTYYDTTTELKEGDTIYYWIHVIYNNLGYNLVNQKYIVKSFYDYNGKEIQSSRDKYNNGTTNNGESIDDTCTRCYVFPVPLIEPLLPNGLRMSIPDEAGISLVAFHVKFNQKFVGLEAGTIARDIVKAKYGRWTYYDTSTELRNGDIIYFWIHVIYKGLGYNLIQQKYRVTGEFYSYYK